MAWAQNPQIIQNTRTMLNTVQQNNIAASNEALGIKPAPAKNSTKATTTPAKASTAAVKNSATSAPAKMTQPKASPVPVKPNVVAAKSNASPAKPNVVAVKSNASSAKPSVNAAKSHASPSKATVVPAKGTAAPSKASVVTTSQSSKSAAPFAPKKASSASAAPKLGIKQVAAKKEAKPATAQKKKVAASKPSPAAATSSATSDASATGQSAESKGSDDDAVKDAQDKKWSMAGKRDPFISPVVSHAGGSGCSTGKKCLEIGQINVRGVVKAESGFIAVVTNTLYKAYFLHENDPVFNGFVVRITGDSVVFQETMQDKLGKPFTREVVKRITTPAV